MSEAPAGDHGLERSGLWIARGVGYLVQWYLIAVQAILGIGFLLRAFGANPSTPFSAWIYRSLDRTMEPFRGLFQPLELGSAQNGVPAVFDTSILFAMVCYGLVLMVVNAALVWMTRKILTLDVRARLQAQRDAYDEATRLPSDLPPDLVGSAAAAPVARAGGTASASTTAPPRRTS